MANEIEKIIVVDAEEVNPLGLDEAQYILIEQMAAMNYTVKYIAIYLDLDEDLVNQEFLNSGSELYRRYQKGRLQSSYEINHKLDHAARGGNITAMQQFERHKKTVQMENLKEKYFG